MKNIPATIAIAAVLAFTACTQKPKETQGSDTEKLSTLDSIANERLKIYEKVELTADLSKLKPYEREMIPLFIEAAAIMDDLFWKQAFGEKESFLAGILNENTRKFAEINYGPWDRLKEDMPFVNGYGKKPLGANLYPADMTKDELEKSDVEDKRGLYSIIRRNKDGKLESIPYHIAYKEELTRASELLKKAAEICEDEALKKYLGLRAEALLSSDYTASDIAWLDMKTNGIDIIIGPIEVYEDKLYNARASFESYVLIKDMEWSKKLSHYVSFLKELQKGLPVEEKYKKEEPGTDSELNAYDVVYYAGDCNAGSKTIAVNLPNDENIQKSKGTRRSQLKNVMKAKFDKILVPISNELISEDQRKYIKFDAFFATTMFHEVAHGLGIKNTVNGKGTVREALAEMSSALEEGKADILGLYMIDRLFEKGEIKEGVIEDYYVTFMASIFRSIRFGASSAHGKANMMRFNYFEEQGAFTKNANGTYSVNFQKMKQATNSLSALILKLQGDGDKEGLKEIMDKMGNISPDLQKDLDGLSAKNIPVDIIFEQGVKVLGL
ncbi:MAG: Zn-dependent hydrolase [Flavobacteriales bacterium]|nr:Zn-dependent hydrolase [Flavobacteriales bacterium]